MIQRSTLAALALVTLFVESTLAGSSGAAAGSNAPADGKSRLVSYDQPVRLSGVLFLEYDMSMIDSDSSPTRDLQEVRRKAAAVRKTLPRSLWWRLEPRPHLILHLDHPISVAARADEFAPAEADVKDIDFGVPRKNGPHRGRAHVVGKLWHAITVHHLREIMGDVVSITATSR
jgi:hypothetical protein